MRAIKRCITCGELRRTNAFCGSYKVCKGCLAGIRQFKIKVHGIIRKSIKYGTNSYVWKFLPYSSKELRMHLEKQFEPWMNWENHGKYNPKTWDDNNSDTWVWQIDHIVPQGAFLFTSLEDESFRWCWALDNLRPLSAKENIRKNRKFTL